jgi:ribonuclease BN (tRNA processing enzyme)
MTVQLECLGSGFAFSNGKYWNGWLLDGRILLDCPAQTLAHLYQMGRSPLDLELILLTHEHGDHISGVDAVMLDLAYRLLEQLDHTIGVAAADGVYQRLKSGIGDSAHFLGRDHEAVRWIEARDGESFEHAHARVDVVEMVHSVPDNGYRVHLDGGVVAYTGDTSPGDHILRLAEGADVLIVECGGAFPGVHCSWDDLRDLRAEVPSSTEMLVTHYDSTTVPEDIGGIAGIVLAQDFESYEFGS